MATAQMQRSSVPVWLFYFQSSVTLPKRIATEQQSLVLIKRLLAVSVSCITYLRGLFPEYAYGTRYLEDICVKILKEDKCCPGSTQLVKWMLGCYDALQKKYLRMVVLALYTDIKDPQTITECYQFKFKYSPSGPIMDFISDKGNIVSACTDFKRSSIMLVRKLYILMQNLGPLPNDVCLTMKLFYYDEVTPMDYQPPGFKEGTCEGMMFEGEPMYLNVGEVATPFHTLKVRVTTEKDRMEHIEMSILKDAENKSPIQPIEMDVDEAKDTGNMDETLYNDSVDYEKNDITCLKFDEINLTCQEDKSMKSENTASQKSQNDVSVQAESSCVAEVRKTRRGRILQDAKMTISEKKQTKVSKGGKKRQQPNKENQALDLSCSQDEPTVPKRRRFSEPKDPI
ncbi:HORMA domain-containing protein 1 isoform X2 [Hyla sarda]|uniref:HORMA domain-containing protein 1 isoform X2 n=1 Tax=Hyla sarda TaxID=327740 RepID=UPI0024C45715|nr:HORMA domain-containing protein 1 isoform X2 [Hyla sarda]XP_056402498.1 HORMA domain-containing protein 1 isoform X2 [Hyla sarda]